MVTRRQKPTPAPSVPPAAGLREAHKRDKSARIREAALGLLRERGFEAMTTREVAERAGIAAGTLFRYVRTKEELVGFVFREQIAEVCAARFATLPRRRDVVEQLLHVFAGLLAFYAQDRDLSRLLLREALFATADSPGFAFTLGFLGQLAQLVAAASARGELRADTPAPALAAEAFFLYLGAVLGVVGGSLRDDAAALAVLRHGLETHFRGLRARAPATHTKGRTR